MAVYYVRPGGNDENSGTSAFNAWATITHAAEVAQAGDIVYIAPGVYRGTVVVANSGTDVSPIQFIGDPSASKFGTLCYPGVVRITGCDEDEIPQSNTVWDFGDSSYVVLKNVVVDGVESLAGDYAVKAKYYSDGIICENVVAHGTTSAFEGVSELYNCLGVGGYHAFSGYDIASKCLGIAGGSVFTGTTAVHCVALGGDFGISGYGYHCIAIASTEGIRNSYNSIEMAVSQPGSSKCYNSLYFLCRGMGGIQTDHEGYRLYCAASPSTGTPYKCAGFTSLRTVKKIAQALMFDIIGFYDKTNSDAPLPDLSDIFLGNISVWDDKPGIGPFASPKMELDYHYFYGGWPGIRITRKGYVRFEFTVKKDINFTVRCRVRFNAVTAQRPRMRITGKDIGELTISATGGGSWETLTIGPISSSHDDVIEVYLEALDPQEESYAIFSDLEVI